MKIRIIQRPRDNAHGKSEVPKRVDGNLPVSKMPAQKQDRASGTHGLHAIIASLKVQHIRAGSQAESARKLDAFADHPKQMSPHSKDNSIRVFIAQRVTKRNRQILSRHMVPTQLLWQYGMDEPRQPIRHGDRRTNRKASHRKEQRQEDRVFKLMSKLAKFHGTIRVRE